MEVKYNAYLVKGWLIQNISPMGWSTLISRALPELLEVNARFSAFYIGRNTRWGADEIYVIRWYLIKLYKKDIPEEVLDEATSVEVKYWTMNNISFFDGARKNIGGLKNLFKNLLNI